MSGELALTDLFDYEGGRETGPSRRNKRGVARTDIVRPSAHRHLQPPGRVGVCASRDALHIARHPGIVGSEYRFPAERVTDEQLGASQVFFEWFLTLVGMLREVDAPLLAGTDAPNPFVLHGFAMHEELELLVDAGLTPYEALVTATRAPAEFLGEADVFGTIATGKRADLVLLDANPIERISNTREIVGVILAGTWHARAELHDVLEGIAASFELPEDWFEGLDPLTGEGTLLVYDWMSDDSPYGAARVLTRNGGEDTVSLQMQSRWKSGSELSSGTYDVEFDSRSRVSSIDYRIDDGSGLSVRVAGGVAKVDTRLGDGTETSQQLGVPARTLILVPNEAAWRR